LTREDGGIMKNMSFDAKNSQNEKREREREILKIWPTLFRMQFFLCFCVLKVLLKKFKFFLFFINFKLIYF